MATNTNPFYTYSATAGSSKTLQKPQDGGDNNQWGNYINTDLDEIVAAVNALSDKIADANEKTLVDFTATGSAVNHVGITNAATGNPPQISSAGSDTNVDLTLTAKGTGDINLTPGTNGDVNIPASKGITFGDDGEKIEGDGTDLTIASSNDLNLTATTDINVPANVGVTFGDDGEKIEGDGTNLTIASSADVIVDAVADIILDADGADIVFKDNATEIGKIRKTDAGNFALQPASGLALDLRNNGANAKIVINNDASMTITAGGNTALSFDTSGNSSIDSRTLDVSSGSFTTSESQKRAILNGGLTGMNYLIGSYRWANWNPSNNTGTYTTSSATGDTEDSVYVSISGTGTVTITFDVAGRYLVETGAGASMGASYTYSDIKITYGGTATRRLENTRWGSGSDDDLNFGVKHGGLIVASATQTVTIKPEFRVSSGTAATSFVASANMTVTYLGGV